MRMRTGEFPCIGALAALLPMLALPLSGGAQAELLERTGVAASQAQRAKFSVEIQPVADDDSVRSVLFVGFFTSDGGTTMETHLRAFRDAGGGDIEMFGDDTMQPGDDSLMMVPRSTLDDVTVTIDRVDDAPGGYEIVVTNQSSDNREIEIIERLRGRWTHAQDHSRSDVDVTSLELPDWGEARILISATPDH